MSQNKLSLRFAQNLQRLLEGDAVNASAFGNKRRLQVLEDDRVVERLPTGRNRALCRCNQPAALKDYLRLQWGITDLSTYIELLGEGALDGESSLSATTSTKTLRSKSLQGFLLKPFDVSLKINGQQLNGLPEGADYFIHDIQHLSCPNDALIVGIENPECFHKIDRLRHWLPALPMVVVLRFYSNRLLDWLEAINNPYLHFGDFDPAGISIYCNEYLKRLGEERCQFFVPHNMDELIPKGQTALFDRQQAGWPPKEPIQQEELLTLINLINQTGKGVEQEMLLHMNA